MRYPVSRRVIVAISLSFAGGPALSSTLVPGTVTEQMLFADDPKQWLTIRRVAPPEYPKEALAAGVTGYVDLAVTIDEVGSVQKIGAVVSRPDNRLFENSARETVMYWEFRPAISRHCVPEVAEGNVRVWFEIRDGKEVVSVSSTPGTMGTATAATTKAMPGMAKIVNREEVMRHVKYPREARQVGAQADVYAVMEVDAGSGQVREVAITHVISSAKQMRWRFSTVVADGLKLARFEPNVAMAGRPFRVCMPHHFRLTN